MQDVVEAAKSGWHTTDCGAEASELLRCMSWMGRQSSSRLAKHMRQIYVPWIHFHSQMLLLEIWVLGRPT